MDERLNDPAWLANAYATRSSFDIARELNCCGCTVLRALRRFGIPVRPSRHSNKGKPMTWEQRQKISETAKRTAARRRKARQTA